jgi:putative tricarboxylic transport membrane protein
MTTSRVQKRKAYGVVGGLVMLVSLGYLFMSFQLPFGERDQPGAAVFPVAVGVIFVLGGLATLYEAWRMDPAVHIELPAGKDRRRLLGLVGLLLSYLVVLPWLGQAVSSALFFIFLMRLLSSYSWARVVVYSMAMAIALDAVFVYLLKVPMPSGFLGF